MQYRENGDGAVGIDLAASKKVQPWKCRRGGSVKDVAQKVVLVTE